MNFFITFFLAGAKCSCGSCHCELLNSNGPNMHPYPYKNTVFKKYFLMWHVFLLVPVPVCYRYPVKFAWTAFTVLYRSPVQCCGSGMFIPDSNFFHPGSAKNNLSILIPNWLSCREYAPDCSSRIRILTFYPSRIPDRGVKKAPDPGSATLLLSASFFVSTCARSLLFLMKTISCNNQTLVRNVPGTRYFRHRILFRHL